MKDLINLRIEAADLEQLKEIARKDDRTVSYLIRQAIREYLNDKTKKP
jgi:predicted transcriptional regulator